MWLEVENVEKSYGGVKALSGLSFSHHKQEILGIIGPNGAGKTTLFDAISGLIRPDHGRVLFEGRDLTRMPPQEVARQGVARCFQSIRLARRLSVVENLTFSLVPACETGFLSAFGGTRAESMLESIRGAACVEMLQRYGLWKSRHEEAGTLSFGQQKLLSIVCCAAREASLILLDEPIAGVSTILAQSIIEVLQQLRAGGKSLLVVEHDMDAVAKLCDRVLFLDQGRLVCEGSLSDVRRDPRVIEVYIH
jgi:branched-chain amino acid transport system ATP-binding protein